jgi:hypothetical protein
MKKTLCSIIIVGLFSSCVTIKPFERQYVNDPEMQMGNDVGKKFINYINSIREGATTAESTNASGGCGCN